MKKPVKWLKQRQEIRLRTLMMKTMKTLMTSVKSLPAKKVERWVVPRVALKAELKAELKVVKKLVKR
jgi:hypothetical protein